MDGCALHSLVRRVLVAKNVVTRSKQSASNVTTATRALALEMDARQHASSSVDLPVPPNPTNHRRVRQDVVTASFRITKGATTATCSTTTAVLTSAARKTDGPVPVLPVGQARVMKNVEMKFRPQAKAVMMATSILLMDVPICVKLNVALPVTGRDRKTVGADAVMAFCRPVNPVTITM